MCVLYVNVYVNVLVLSHKKRYEPECTTQDKADSVS